MKQKIIGILLCILLCTTSACGKQEKEKKEDTPNRQETVKEPTIKENMTVEIGTELYTINDFFTGELSFQKEEITYWENEKEIRLETAYNELKTYDVKITVDEKNYQTKLTVVDTTVPELTLKDVKITEGTKYSTKDFTDICKDNSAKECVLSFKETKDANYTKAGTYEITVTAEDSSGNKTEATATLTIQAKKQTSASKPSSTSSGNTSQTQKPSSSESSTSEPTFVEKKEEVTKERIPVKYGGIQVKVKTYTYDLYSDGSKRNQRNIISYEYDSSGFKATTQELLPEATQNRTTYANEVNEILKRVNAYRAEVGATPLALDETLTKAAMVRALEIGYGVYSHTRPDGRDCFTAMDEVGYSRYATAGENIAAGYKTPEAVSIGWYNSPKHKENMLNPEFGRIGIGVVVVNGYHSWVQMFSN